MNILALQVIVIGVVMLFSAYWQLKLFEKYRNRSILIPTFSITIPTFLVPPVVITYLLSFTFLLKGAYLYIVTPGMDSAEAAFIWLEALLFGGLLIAKTFIGPLLNGIILSYSIYIFSETGNLEILPIMEWTINLIFTNANGGIVFVYTMIFMLYTFLINVSNGIQWS